jgi:hypothetical protein
MVMKEHMIVHQTWAIHTVKHIELDMELDGINKRNWEEHLAVIHEMADKATTTTTTMTAHKHKREPLVVTKP